MRPLVSVVIPVYNGENFVGRAMDSVLGQTFSNLEVVVVDDGFNDHSSAIVSRYLSDPRVHCVYEEANRGQPAAMNVGINLAHGEFVAFLDCDDSWLPTKLQKQLPQFDRPIVAAVYTRKVEVNVHGMTFGERQLTGRRTPRSGWVEQDLLYDNF